MAGGNQLFNRKRNSRRADEYVSRATLQLLDFDGGRLPEYAWRRQLNSEASNLKEFNVTFMEAIRMMRLGMRLWSHAREEASHGRKAPIDPFNKERTKPSASQGVPLGGMGSCSISRGFRGEFKHWQIVPGRCEMSPVMANQFSIFISRDGGSKKYSSVLAPGHDEGLKMSMDDGISSWNWNLSGEKSSYHALFPRAWTVYDGEPDPELKISCRQISPFIPHDYQDSSLPTSVFVYTLVNTGLDRADITLLMTWANSVGGSSHHSGGHINEPFIGEDGVSGVLLHHKIADDYPPVTFAIAARETQNVSVSVLPVFGLSGENHVTAEEMWRTIVLDGRFDKDYFNSSPSKPSFSGETICAAVCASTSLEPQSKCSVVFALSWSSPYVKFQKGRIYSRRFTKFYGTSEKSAIKMVHDAIMKYKQWETCIDRWQSPILQNERLPEWYRFTVFNELYFLVAGGTVWIDKEALKVSNDHVTQSWHSDIDETREDDLCSLRHPLVASTGVESDDPENVGKFLYLEGVEYFMWCTYDVHFYASFALLDLFPKIELSIQRDFARAVLCEDQRKIQLLAEGGWGVRKVKGAVPHDLGNQDPWYELNAYNIHDTSKWKDLNPKFVLQVYRDVAKTGDMVFAREVWPAVRAAMEYMEQFDRDCDDLIENDGFPDQTYDAWTVRGLSAYCGCLWLAALEAAGEMANRLGEHAFADKCMRKLARAKHVFESKLWNGSYFNYDSGTQYNSQSIHADQLAGQWYIASLGLPSLFDESRIRSALQKIFDFNVRRVKCGRMGAVNGMLPNGKVDETCMQSREIWTGVTYSLAATMLLHGMESEGFTTAEGIYIAGWSEEGYGYWFQTPEAWTIDGHYRSLVYMRPLAIWSMQWALSCVSSTLQPPRINIMERLLSPLGIKSVDSSAWRVSPRRSCWGSSVATDCDS